MKEARVTFAVSGHKPGDVISTDEIHEYTDTIKLGLRCPVCDIPVYFVQASKQRSDFERTLRQRDGSTRIVKVSGFGTEAHFCHRALSEADSAIAYACENRTDMGHSRVREFIASPAKGQRLEILQSNLWSIVDYRLFTAPPVYVSQVNFDWMKAKSGYPLFDAPGWASTPEHLWKRFKADDHFKIGKNVATGLIDLATQALLKILKKTSFDDVQNLIDLSWTWLGMDDVEHYASDLAKIEMAEKPSSLLHHVARKEFSRSDQIIHAQTVCEVLQLLQYSRFHWILHRLLHCGYYFAIQHYLVGLEGDRAEPSLMMFIDAAYAIVNAVNMAPSEWEHLTHEDNNYIDRMVETYDRRSQESYTNLLTGFTSITKQQRRRMEAATELSPTKQPPHKMLAMGRAIVNEITAAACMFSVSNILVGIDWERSIAQNWANYRHVWPIYKGEDFFRPR